MNEHDEDDGDEWVSPARPGLKVYIAESGYVVIKNIEGGYPDPDAAALVHPDEIDWIIDVLGCVREAIADDPTNPLLTRNSVTGNRGAAQPRHERGEGTQPPPGQNGKKK